MRFVVAAAVLVACDAFAPAFPAMKGLSPARFTRSNWKCATTTPEPTTTTVQASEAKKNAAKFASSIFKEAEGGKSKNRAYVLDRNLAGQKPGRKPDDRKTVIITGASGGIGMAAAKALSLYVSPPRRPPPSPTAKHQGAWQFPLQLSSTVPSTLLALHTPQS